MSQWAFARTDDGSLVNLYKMETIFVASIEEEDSRPTPDATHEVLASPGNDYTYRLYYGSEEQCQDHINRLASMLEVN